MSILSNHPAIRWAVPVVVVGIAVGGTALATELTANAGTTLAPRSAAQLLVDLQTARVSAGSGTVVEQADLGLPQLPTTGGAGSSDLSSLIAGSHTLRLWYSGQSKARVALLGTLGESDVIRNGRDLWTWSSTKNSATHQVLPKDGTKDGVAEKSPSLDDLGGVTGSPQTPQQVADEALAAIDPSTTVTTDGSARVAGRDAYELVLTPKDTSSLIGQVRIAIDAIEHVPLRVQVFGKNTSTPSAEVGFTQISFTRPADSQFAFSPPPGVKVTTEAGSSSPLSGLGAAKPQVSGTGWTAVLSEQLPVSAGTLTKQTGKDDASAAELGRVLSVLPRVSGSWGSGRLLRSKMFSALLTDDGRVLVGAVSPDRLYQVAAQAKR